MKYIVVLGDGMADEPIEALGGKTIIEHANTPCLDRLSKASEIGMVHTIPEGMSPGSDTANLSVLGYDPKKYYSGRSPLEALSIGVPMTETDIALRCNIVTISDDDVMSIGHFGSYGNSGICYAEHKGLILEEFAGNFETGYNAIYLWSDNNSLIEQTYAYYYHVACI